MEIDNLEMDYCSQKDTYKACIRFENSILEQSYNLQDTKPKKEITNSVFHQGEGKGFNIENSNDVKFDGNYFYDLKIVGGRVKGSKRITLERNIIAHVGD